MSLLELGSGPGFITEALLTLLPNSQITCVEIDPQLIERAKQYLRGKAKDKVQYLEGSLMELQLGDDSYDFAYARLVFQHLPDPISTAKEIRRVLKPGGRLVIYDIDDEIFGLFQPALPEISIAIEKMGQAQAAGGGNRNVGRSLWRILKAAGFINLDLEIIATHSDDIGIEPFLPQLDPDRMLRLVKMGLLSEQELDKIRTARATFLTAPDKFILMLSLMACGEKAQPQMDQ